MTFIQILQENPVFLYTSIFIVGLCIGSFLNVVISRLPPLIDDELADMVDHPLPNLIRPGSHCPHCKQQIRWFDNIPLLSYLLLGGRCRDCKEKISTRYFWIELMTGLIFISCAIKFGLTTTLLWSLILSSMLIALTFIDLDTWLLPDSITLPGIGLGLLCNLSYEFVPIYDAVIGAIAGYSVLWLIYQIHHRLTSRQGMGYGDFKLLGMLGAWLGWQSLPIIMLLSSIAGIIIFLILKLTMNFDHTRPIPFGPFLAVAGWLYMINQTHLMQIISPL